MGNIVTHFSNARANPLATLADRVRSIVDKYWGGSVNAAASSMGIPQQTLQRVVSGTTANPRVSVLDAIAKGSRASVDWLMTGTGRGPQESDERGRFITGGTSRWLRVVSGLYPERGGSREVLEDVPFAAFRFAALLSSGKGKLPLRTVTRVQDKCAEAWSDLLEEAIALFGAEAVRARLDANEIVVAGGFTPFIQFVSKTAISKAEVKRLLQAWENELTRND